MAWHLLSRISVLHAAPACFSKAYAATEYFFKVYAARRFSIANFVRSLNCLLRVCAENYAALVCDYACTMHFLSTMWVHLATPLGIQCASGKSAGTNIAVLR